MSRSITRNDLSHRDNQQVSSSEMNKHHRRQCAVVTPPRRRHKISATDRAKSLTNSHNREVEQEAGDINLFHGEFNSCKSHEKANMKSLRCSSACAKATVEQMTSGNKNYKTNPVASRAQTSSWDLCDSAYCSECRYREKCMSRTGYLIDSMSSYLSDFCCQASQTQEDPYIPDTHNNFQLMLPLLTCENFDCIRCYRLTPVRLSLKRTTIDNVLGWARDLDENHEDQCRFQAERKCRREWPSERHWYFEIKKKHLGID